MRATDLLTSATPTDDAARVDGEPETLVLLLDDEPATPIKTDETDRDAIEEPATLLLTIDGDDAPTPRPEDTKRLDEAVLRDLEDTPMRGDHGLVTDSGATTLTAPVITFA